MPNFKQISFRMAELQGAGIICPHPPMCVCYPKDPMWNRVKVKDDMEGNNVTIEDMLGSLAGNFVQVTVD